MSSRPRNKVVTKMDLLYFRENDFRFVTDNVIDQAARLGILADMSRVNTFSEVKMAGSGHLGSSLSATDVMTVLYYEVMNIRRVGFDSPNRDIFFSSKGHDAPAQYAILHSLGLLSEDQLFGLRRLGGLDGHPDRRIPGIEMNTGSLGMGLSKGKGVALGKRLLDQEGRVFVLLGDGELQEGQNYEALQSAGPQGVSGVTVMIDRNAVQTDRAVDDIVTLGDLESKLRTFGWDVVVVDGHDFQSLVKTLSGSRSVPRQAIILNTIKGKGISFMEHPAALGLNDGFYPWHSGAPSDDVFLRGQSELVERVETRLSDAGVAKIECSKRDYSKASSSVTREYVLDGFGRALVDEGSENERLVVLDADLEADCKLDGFRKAYPDRFIECGIAEQDMVSTAAGLASVGLVPVVSSFSSFLSSRSNEQIYNSETEHNKVIYGFNYAGVLPAGPGKSHQSVRDISLVSSLPDIEIIAPINQDEAYAMTRYAVANARSSVVLRMPIGPMPTSIAVHGDRQPKVGVGHLLRSSGETAIVSYGPVITSETMKAADVLSLGGVDVRIVIATWLNRFDKAFWEQSMSRLKHLIIVEDHSSVGGLASMLIPWLVDELEPTDLPRIHVLGVDGIPECGTPAEVLSFHKLDGASLAEFARAL